MIKYDRATKDYTVTLDGEYIGSRETYTEAADAADPNKSAIKPAADLCKEIDERGLVPPALPLAQGV